jgi:protein SCO1/2
MTDRRKMLTGITQALSPKNASQDCECATSGHYANYLPNAVVLTHEGRRALFYNDLLRNRVVLINCFSIHNEEVYPVIENLVAVQRLLGEKSGRDIFIYSITTDPERDTPRALRAFAEKRGIKPGWLLLTGPTDTVDSLRARLFASGGGHHQGVPLVKDCSLGLIRYGNEAAGLWASCPAKTEPEWIVERLRWIEPRQRPATQKRKGPFEGTHRV